ncbi:fimbrial protein [Klebsiella michiganensis]|uniref:fimbrial protein n=1 Tax=Klebsiella michiganensis TaxID=1134687 RepID=UPI00256EA0FF|nr:fimbrial protein [Klebsiella michiganensis]MDL5429861.1 fimbrial protein [Klebsiella michiganensis]
MKISKLSAVLALAVSTAAISSFSAQATDGTITFNGRVTDQTCTISTPGGKDFTVTLPTVSASTLAAQSATAGRTPFAINLSDCSKGNVATYFEPGAALLNKSNFC